MDLAGEQERIRQLPVFRELEHARGPSLLDGRPSSVYRGGVSRMAWAWNTGGLNLHLYVDHGSQGWRVLAAGPAGRIEFTLGAAERPTHVNLRAVAVAAGLLAGPAE